MINTEFKKIILGLFLVIVVLVVVSVGWYYIRTLIMTKEPIKPESNREFDILSQIFKDSSIVVLEKERKYEIEGENKVETDILGQSIIKKKIVNIKLLNIDLDQDRQDEIIVLTNLTFLGPVCVTCRERLYIDVLNIENGKYIIKKEQEFKGNDSDLFHSDISIKEIQLIDINNDDTKEIQVVFKSDNYSGLDKIKVAIFQWQNNEFKIIWQQVTYFNMDNYSMFQEEDKYNYDATFTFESSNGEYSDIIVDKIILKEKGIELITPRKEQSIYKWDIRKQEYYLWKEEKIGEEKP